MSIRQSIPERLPASTLVEVLILMIISGIVFLSVMDGIGLLRRFLDRTSLRIAERTDQYAGYFRTADLTGLSDSLLTEDEHSVALYRGGAVHARIALADSALVVLQAERGERADTLLHGVVRLRTVPQSEPGRHIDTLIVELLTQRDSVLRIGFGPRRRSDPLLEKLAEAEAQYRYDEDEPN